MTRIKLTQDKYAKVDEKDLDLLNQFKWRFDGKYAVTEASRKIGRKKIYMHRMIMGTPEGMDTDHINRDRLDNRRINLRICTHQENSWNLSVPKHNKSGFMGVSFWNLRKKWRAIIKVGGKIISLGSFDNKEDAILARKKGELKYHPL